jgi:UDP:flavonoid glycosyltransferase YjiC (YdhE family)
MAARAAASTGSEVVVVTANRDVSDQQWPDGVTVVDWVNMLSELAGCLAAIHHAGAGTAYAAIDSGVPAVCMPQLGDQFRNATLLTRSGACVSIEPEEASETRLRVLLTKVLEERSYSEAARRLHDLNQSLPDTHGLVRRLTAVV